MARRGLKKAFLKFDRENPGVFRELRRLALDLINRGWKHYGISPLWEVMRYKFNIKFPGEEAKFPNNHRAYYARALMLQVPELKDFFSVRELRSGEVELELWELPER